MITEQQILTQLQLMPETLKQEVLHYMLYLLNNYNKEAFSAYQQSISMHTKKPVFGSAKGKYTLAADFDEPIDDFKEYMQ
jgi:hypothetical protein